MTQKTERQQVISGRLGRHAPWGARKATAGKASRGARPLGKVTSSTFLSREHATTSRVARFRKTAMAACRYTNRNPSERRHTAQPWPSRMARKLFFQRLEFSGAKPSIS